MTDNPDDYLYLNATSVADNSTLDSNVTIVVKTETTATDNGDTDESGTST